MLEISSKTNLLEQKSYKYSLQDVAEPNLQRDVYSYGTIPKVAFNHRRVPMSMPEEIWITDTSLRDGQQSVEPYSVDQIVNIYKLLSKLGGPYGIIRQTEFFIYSKKDREAIEKCMALDLKFPEITSWIRATKEDFQLVHDLGIKETGILVSCSRLPHLQENEDDEKTGHGLLPCHGEGSLQCRSHSPLPSGGHHPGGLLRLRGALRQRIACELSREAGVPVKIRACDTMGYGVPLYRSGAAAKRGGHYLRLAALFRRSQRACWNGTATTISTRAWPTPPRRGSTAPARSTVPCSASASGRAMCRWRPWCLNTRPCVGSLDGMDTTVITEIADYFKNEIGYNIPPMTPFVGSAFNVTRAGVHADGLMKDEEIYNIFNTKKLLNRPAARADQQNLRPGGHRLLDQPDTTVWKTARSWTNKSPLVISHEGMGRRAV